MEATQVSIARWTDTQKCTYTHGILCSPKNEGNSDTCYSMDELWRYYAKKDKLVKKGWMLYDSIYMSYLGWSNLQRLKECLLPMAGGSEKWGVIL